MVELPPFHEVRKVRASAPPVADVELAVRQELGALLAASPLPAGAPVAVTCGSRGIDRIAEVTRAACAVLRDAGAKPFVVPAMGSHGGGTAEGQRRVLAEYGVTEESAGVPVISSLETQALGRTPEGIEVFMDRAAFGAGRVLVLGRVKPHTTFDGEVESGLLKMLTVGLGKLQGARAFHQSAMRFGFARVLISTGRLSLASGRIWAGLGLVENDGHKLARIAAVPASGIERLDRELLVLARRLYSRLPFDELDLLIVDEIGKNISGTGMDTKVIGRTPHPDISPLNAEGITHIRRIYARDLTPESEGNACGVGFADVIHRRLFEKIDLEATYTNGRTALAFEAMRVPMYFESDAAALEFLLENLGSPPPEQLRAARIRNTLCTSDFLASTACAALLAGSDAYQVGDSADLEFSTGSDLANETEPRPRETGEREQTEDGTQTAEGRR
jgi:hypothetical protein